MKNALGRAKASAKKRNTLPPTNLDGAEEERPSIINPPTLADVYRYRYAHGANVGSLFVQERWLLTNFYPEACSGTSELAAVTCWVQKEGLEKTRDRYQTFWKEFVSPMDLNWLQDVGRCNSIRLPIGYFTLGPAYCHRTPFEDVSFVYQNAWDYVKLLVKRLHRRGIGTLLDFHALPGGANPGDHSGTNSGKAEFWKSGEYKTLATRCLCFIAHQVEKMEGIIGIQLVNEAEANATGMYLWYDEVLDEFSKINPAMPVYISDSWNLAKTVDWVATRNKSCGKGNPVVIDTHLYWCFTDEDSRKPASQITAEVSSKLSEVTEKAGNVLTNGAVQVIVGEYSCVLTDQSWNLDGSLPKSSLVRQFGNAQSRHYQQRAGGSYMWTYRMTWMPGGEWGFKQMTEQLAVLPTAALTLTIEQVQQRIYGAQGQMDEKKRMAFTQHCEYDRG